MTTRVEDTDGVRTYYVNDVAYKKLEDIPEEFRQYFTDANNNGFPDQFDSLIDMARGQKGMKDFLKSSLTEAFNSTSPDLSSPNSTSTRVGYRGDQGTSTGFPFYIKALFFILIGLLAAWFVISRLPADSGAAEGEGTEQIPTDEVNSEVTEPDVATESFSPEEFQFVMEDPNEPPYKVYANLLKHGGQVFRFDLPDGEVVSSGTERILWI